MTLLKELYETYWYQKADQRMIELPFMKCPIPALATLAVYWFVIKNGPKWMETKPAYNIKPIIQTYNIFQVVVCAICGIRVTHLLLQKDFWCRHYLLTSDYDMALVFYSWAYMMIKVADLFDTLFFILRKKFYLITTLHIYHHFSMVLAPYLLLRYYPAGELSMIIAVNSLVHTVMYSYYFYCLNNKSKQEVWWKKHITHLQMTQFCFLVSNYIYKLFFVKNCSFPTSIIVFCICYGVSMLSMFSAYYYHTFIKAKTPKRDINRHVNMNMQLKTA